MSKLIFDKSEMIRAQEYEHRMLEGLKRIVEQREALLVLLTQFEAPYKKAQAKADSRRKKIGRMLEGCGQGALSPKQRSALLEELKTLPDYRNNKPWLFDQTGELRISMSMLLGGVDDCRRDIRHVRKALTQIRAAAAQREEKAAAKR